MKICGTRDQGAVQGGGGHIAMSSGVLHVAEQSAQNIAARQLRVRELRAYLGALLRFLEAVSPLVDYFLQMAEREGQHGVQFGELLRSLEVRYADARVEVFHEQLERLP
jgi:hypothetical protein